MLDLELSAIDLDEDKVDELFDMVKNSGLSEDVKEGFSQRRLEFLEDFSASIVKITKAHEAHSKLYKSKACVSGTIGRKRSQEDGLVSDLFILSFCFYPIHWTTIFFLVLCFVGNL